MPNCDICVLEVVSGYPPDWLLENVYKAKEETNYKFLNKEPMKLASGIVQKSNIFIGNVNWRNLN